MKLIAGITVLDENNNTVFIENGSLIKLKMHTDDEPRIMVFKWTEHTQIAGALFAGIDSFNLVVSDPSNSDKRFEKILAIEVESCELLKEDK